MIKKYIIAFLEWSLARLIGLDKGVTYTLKPGRLPEEKRRTKSERRARALKTWYEERNATFIIADGTLVVLSNKSKENN